MNGITSRTYIEVPKNAISGGVPESEVGSQISRLNVVLSELDQRVRSLADRLEPVLMPQSCGVCDGKETAPVVSLSPTADRVRDAAWVVESVTARVETLLSNLAV